LPWLNPQPLYIRWSSLPSRVFLMLQFLNNLTIISSLTLNHDCFIHWHTCLIVGCFKAPYRVNTCWVSSIINLLHFSLIYTYNSLFIETPRGSNCQVSPPRITASSVFPCLNFSFTEFFKWLLNWSSTRRELFFNKITFLLSHSVNP
jgi:hypothetical protein